MKKLIKELFNLYDEEDLNKAKCNTYIKAYEEGKKFGEQQGLFKKYTLNDLRKILGLGAIVTSKEEEELTKESE